MLSHSSPCRVPMDLRFTQRPWTVQPFDALRKLRHAQVTQPNFTKSALWMSFDKVRQRTSSLQDVVAQITSKKVQTPWTDILRGLSEEGSEPNQDGLESGEQRRSIENGVAVGGLRSPHESIRHLPRAEQVGGLIKKTPLGIEEPIQPGGVFPPADQAAAKVPLDECYNDAI